MGVQAGLILMHLLQMSTFNSTFLALLGLLGINASTAWKCFDILHHPPVNKSPILGQTDKPMQPNILSLTVIYRVRLYKSLRTQPCKDAARDSRLQDLSQTQQLFFFFFKIPDTLKIDFSSEYTQSFDLTPLRIPEY